MSDLPDRHLINRELLTDTAEQIQKDLGLAELEIESGESERTPYDRLFDSVLPVMRSMIERDLDRLPQVLYRIDLGESLVLRAMESPQTPEILTEAIIKRCFQKVVLRRMYSKRHKEN